MGGQAARQAGPLAMLEAYSVIVLLMADLWVVDWSMVDWAFGSVD